MDINLIGYGKITFRINSLSGFNVSVRIKENFTFLLKKIEKPLILLQTLPASFLKNNDQLKSILL